MKTSQSWDSPRSAAKFILGAFLIVGLFQFVKLGYEEVFFLIQEGENPKPTVIDLTKTPDLQRLPRGYVQVTGYPVQQETSTYIDAQAPSFFSADSYIVKLSSSPQPGTNRIFVEIKRKEVTTPANPSVPRSLDPNKIVQFTGIHGYHASLRAPLSLDEGAALPKWDTLLLWFLPAHILFLTGIIFLFSWGRQVKKQMF